MPWSGAPKGGTNLCQSIGHHGLTGGSSPPAGTVVVEVSEAIGGGCLGGYLLLGSWKISDSATLPAMCIPPLPQRHMEGAGPNRGGGNAGGPRKWGVVATFFPAPPRPGASGPRGAPRRGTPRGLSLLSIGAGRSIGSPGFVSNPPRSLRAARAARAGRGGATGRRAIPCAPSSRVPAP